VKIICIEVGFAVPSVPKLMPFSEVVHEKLIVAQLVKN
jgi:hypothetical protein